MSQKNMKSFNQCKKFEWDEEVFTLIRTWVYNLTTISACSAKQQRGCTMQQYIIQSICN